MSNYYTILEKVLHTPFIELDVEIDTDTLLKEYDFIERKYSFENYNTKYWPVKRKYAKSWSGICLISSDGELYSDMHEGTQSNVKETKLKNECPYFYQIIENLGGEENRARIMRISPYESLVWHSHTQEHGQPEWMLTVQVPIVMPDKFEYCVVDKNEFKWYKRFYKPNWFKTISRKSLKVGKPYIFNSYHYHNVYNYSKEYRITLMLYLNLKKSKTLELVKRSIEKNNKYD